MPIKIIERTQTLTLTDFLTQDVTCDSNKKGEGIGMADYEGYTLIGQWKVPKQLVVAVGKRPSPFDQFVCGLFHVALHDSSKNDIEGDVKVVVSNAQQTRKAIVVQRRTKFMNKTSPMDRSKVDLLKLGVNTDIYWVRQDGYIQLYFKPDVNGKTIDYDNPNNVLMLDITTQNLWEGTEHRI